MAANAPNLAAIAAAASLLRATSSSIEGGGPGGGGGTETGAKGLYASGGGDSLGGSGWCTRVTEDKAALRRYASSPVSSIEIEGTWPEIAIRRAYASSPDMTWSTTTTEGVNCCGPEEIARRRW